MNDEELEKYKEVGHTSDNSPEVLEDISKKGVVVTVGLGESTSKFGNKANVTEEFLHINTSRGMSFSNDGEKCIVTFPNGNQQEVNQETAKQFAENGVGNESFMPVTAVREVTEYEKEEINEKKRKLPVIIPIILAGLMIAALPFMFKGCNDKTNNVQNIQTPDTTPIIDIEKVSPEEISQALTTMYGCSYDRVLECLEDPGTIVRIAQDAYEAADYDMQTYLGSDLCKYSVIQQGIVNPGAEYIARVDAFKQKYSQITEFDAETYKQMMADAGPLLSENATWIDTALALVVEHAKTTQATIDSGQRVNDYSQEIIVTNAQATELQNKKAKCLAIIDDLAIIETKIDGISNGTLEFATFSDGVFIVSENTAYMRDSSNVASKTIDSNQTLTEPGSSGLSK